MIAESPEFIRGEFVNSGSNKYFKDGREISRAEAWAYAEKLVGKHLTKAQWNW